jgi:hypothetical protein
MRLEKESCIASDARMHACDPQPLRESLRIHARFRGVAGVAAALALPGTADAPGPLEAGHRRARSLILTPAEVKRSRGRTQRPPRRPSSLVAAPRAAAEQPDLMAFSPDAACTVGSGAGARAANPVNDHAFEQAADSRSCWTAGWMAPLIGMRHWGMRHAQAALGSRRGGRRRWAAGQPMRQQRRRRR